MNAVSKIRKDIHDNTDERSAVHGAEDSLAPPLGVAFVNAADVGRTTGSLGTSHNSHASRPSEGIFH